MDDRRFGVAAAALVLATPIAAWWLIGDLSFKSRFRSPDRGLDYIFRAPAMPTWVGVVSLVVAVAALAIVAQAVWMHGLDRRWIRVLGVLMMAGALVAFIGRLATAGVVGANIGGGLAMFLGLPFAAALAAVAVFDAAAIGRERRVARATFLSDGHSFVPDSFKRRHQ